jgi:hypothetical protein
MPLNKKAPGQNIKNVRPVETDEAFGALQDVLDDLDRPVQDEGRVRIQNDLVGIQKCPHREPAAEAEAMRRLHK